MPVLHFDNITLNTINLSVIMLNDMAPFKLAENACLALIFLQLDLS